MTELLLVSKRRESLKPLVEAALANELRLMDAGIARTERRLREFEARYELATADFLRRFENDELDETLEYAEWIGEHRLLMRLKDKADTLRGIQFAN
jgi:hypothetical protein